MLRKKETMTIITPIPGFIPRQLAIDILHSHGEVITLNPLVLDYKPISAPRDALSDEYFSSWYSITERIQYIPGMGKVGSGKISFNGCFHDMPWGLQTHIYAPMNIDMRNRYRIQGNQPGIEPPEITEIGLSELGAPKDGLYLREDIEIKCNITMMSFVKSEMKKASKDMVGRMIKKAELLDAGVLKAMFQDGRLKTINPADRSEPSQQLLRQSTYIQDPYSPVAGPASPNLSYQHPQQSPSFPHYSRPGTSSSQNPYPQQYLPQQTPPPQQQQQVHAPPVPPKTQGQSFPMELPGDYYHPSTSRSPSLHQAQHSPGFRNSYASQNSDPRYSQPQLSPGMQPPGYGAPQHGYPGFTAELPAPVETHEEHQSDRKY